MPDDDSTAVGEDIRFLAGLFTHGATPPRVVLATTEMVLRWQSAAEDEPELGSWLEALWQMLNDGVLAQEDAIGNLDRADKRSGPAIGRVLDGLRDSRAVVTAALDRLAVASDPTSPIADPDLSELAPT